MNEVNEMTRWATPGKEEVPRDTLQMQIDIYEESILLRGFDGDNTWLKTVSADEIANVFTQHIGFRSGLMPENALWWSQGNTGQLVALWREPRVWPIALQREAFAAPARLLLPMPGLVFVCSPGRAPWVYAARRRPADVSDMLYRMPTFNVFQDGRVCPGSHRFPDEVDQIPESFFQSFFSRTGDTLRRSMRHPDDLLALWDELDGEQQYPLDDLMPQCTVAEAMERTEGRMGARFGY